jgi:hypothetical protein
VGVNVLIGRKPQLRDGPLGIWRQLRHEWGIDFPIEYLAELEGKPSELDPDRAVVTSAEQLSHHVGRLADFLRRYGQGLLTGSGHVYREVGAIGRRRSRELTDWATGKAKSP